MPHLTREELQRWWDHGQPSDRERIVGHLAECDACGALYAEILDGQAVTPDETIPAPRVVLQRGYRAYRPAGGGDLRAFWSRGRLVAGLAAAAVVLIAVVFPVLRGPGPAAPERDGIRGSSLQALAPIGDVSPPLQFRWASPVDAVRFAVEVRDDGGQLVFALSTDGTRADPTAGDTARLEPGRTYWWEVIAFGPEDQEIMRARPRPFRVVPARR